MKAFAYDQHLIEAYESFSRSFTEIRAEDLKNGVDASYAAGRFWPDALLSLNPRYLQGQTVDDLVASGDLEGDTGKIFRSEQGPIQFYRHQEQAIAKAGAGQSFVVTTGTGSGKSLCFFVPIVDAIMRSRRAGQPRKTSAIVIYPMNALANSQLKEIEKFISQSGLPDAAKPVVRRYTGQESQEERRGIADDPPDILLTNFMMAELLLTRQEEVDRAVVNNAQGLRFIVLDELHTYRGRQGADVAALVRRLRNRCAEADHKPPICIGTSATMANEGSTMSRAEAIAQVATRLFGAEVGQESVIDESLRRATDDSLHLEQVRPQLADVLAQELPATLTDDALRQHPLAVWVELALGLEDSQELRRKKPVAIKQAVELLAQDSGVAEDACRDRLEEFLTRASLPESERGGSGETAFLAFKLHRFVSGAGDIYTSLTERPRRVLLEGQTNDPEAPERRLYPTRFCRECGHEAHVVTRVEDLEGVRFLPRSIDDEPMEGPDGDVAGYLIPVAGNDREYKFTAADELDSYPEDWREEHQGAERLRPYRKPRIPQLTTVAPNGHLSPSGQPYWFIPGKLGFCPCCLNQPVTSERQRNLLRGLSGEGRSSATTMLVSSALEWMNREAAGMPLGKRKLLGFTDNRQDAALQAGHFNDFLFVSVLRGAVLRAVLDAGKEGITEDEFGLRVVNALGFTTEKKDTWVHWLLQLEARATTREDAQKTLAKVLAHRVWVDLRRGWRYTNPSLRDLGLIDVEFLGLQEIAADSDSLAAILPALRGLNQEEKRMHLLREVLLAMLEGLAVSTESLDPMLLETVTQRSRNLLCSPWAIDMMEKPRSRATLLLKGPRRGQLKPHEELTYVGSGPQSRIGRRINRQSVLGTRLGKDDYFKLMQGVMDLLVHEGLAQPVAVERNLHGWRLKPNAVRLVPGSAAANDSEKGNRYFRGLYRRIAEELAQGASAYWGLESREHTAQVTPRHREWREWRFRYEGTDLERLKTRPPDVQENESGKFLPALFCSPTLELGVDISALNAVYLRNVPPTPANYVQRAGRAGRSGQAAVIVTYCAAQSPHDQYFFSRRSDMVAGIVRPPALDITNEDLVRSHLHAVWLAEAGLPLSPDIPKILALEEEQYPLRQDILAVIRQPSLVDKARRRMSQVLGQILKHAEKHPEWLDDPDQFVLEIAQQAPDEFNHAFDRWRELYRGAHAQLREANTRSQTPGLSKQDRRRIKAAQALASDQIALLEQGADSNAADFYSYRYLATEGFLPGYNFPRLPLYAFIPGQDGKGAFITRARFLAISEFGPRSLIYHEGRAYRVIKAKLPPEVQNQDGSGLATKDIHICANCGASHEDTRERCHACNEPMADEIPVKRTLRINNVEAIPVERITANDEERIRQGFDIQTVFAWARRHGQPQFTEADFLCEGRPTLRLQYGNSAEISRINKGLRRRRERTVLGFNIDPQSGHWAKSEDDSADDDGPDAVQPVRIVPIVQDRKNALLLRLLEPKSYDPETLATIQHALMRGMEVVFQLEEGELLSEPLPDRDNRRAILFYEATEGGAGVLGRMLDSAAINKAARAALELMHFKQVDAAVAAGNGALLLDDEDKACVRGCYRCLLSYYNQPDQERIDRRSDEVKQMLIDLARGKMAEKRMQKAERASPQGEDAAGWRAAFSSAGLPSPDAGTQTVAGAEMPFVWTEHRVAATPEALSAEATNFAQGKGWALFKLPATPAEGIPAALASMLRGASQ